MPSSFHPQSLSVSQMFIAHRLWRGGQPSKRLPTLKVEVQRTLEGRLFLNTWSVGKEDLHIYLWYVWDEDAAMAQTFGSPFLRESFYSIHRSCSECIYMTWSIEICYAAWLEFCETINSSMWTKLQLFGLGVANVVGSAFSAYPTTGYNFNTAPHHFTIYRSFFQLDVHMLKYGVPSHNFVRILAKVASVSEWQHCIWLVRSASSCKRNCSMYLFLHSVSESTHLSYLEKPSTTNSCDGLVITFLDVEHRFPQ